MNTKVAKSLCININEKLEILEDAGSDISFLEWFDDPIDILAGAVIARGYLDGYVEITDKTLPYLEKTLKAMTKAAQKVDR